MKEKSDYQHLILHSIGTKVVGICISKQNYAAIWKKSMSRTLQNEKKILKLPKPTNKTPTCPPPEKQNKKPLKLNNKLSYFKEHMQNHTNHL